MGLKEPDLVMIFIYLKLFFPKCFLFKHLFEKAVSATVMEYLNFILIHSSLTLNQDLICKKAKS